MTVGRIFEKKLQAGRSFSRKKELATSTSDRIQITTAIMERTGNDGVRLREEYKRRVVGSRTTRLCSSTTVDAIFRVVTIVITAYVKEVELKRAMPDLGLRRIFSLSVLNAIGVPRDSITRSKSRCPASEITGHTIWVMQTLI